MNTIEVSFEDQSLESIASAKDIRAFLNQVCTAVGLSNVEFSVSFVNEENMRQLNKEYRNIDDSTDILSFAMTDDVDDFAFVSPSRRKKNLGDMVICPQALQRNCVYFNVTAIEELHRLLIHGVLHLSGENHETNEASEPMLQKQEQLLKQLKG